MSKSMNVLQRANLTATFLVFTSIIGGMVIPTTHGTTLHEYIYRHPKIICLAIFMILFRLKMFFDDHKHFGEPDQGTKNERFYGFILAVFSWLLWGLAGAVLSNLSASAESLASALAISTAWIFIHLHEMRKERTENSLSILRRNYWVSFNLGYIGALLFISAASSFSYIQHANLVINLCFIFLFILLIIDFRLSQPYRDFWEV